MTGAADPDDPMVIRRAAVDETLSAFPADAGCRRRLTVARPLDSAHGLREGFRCGAWSSAWDAQAGAPS